MVISPVISPMLDSPPLRHRATGLPSASRCCSLWEGPVMPFIGKLSHPPCTGEPPTSTCCVHAEASSREQTGIGPECPGEGLCGRSPLTAMLCTLTTCCLARGGRVATPPSGWRSDDGPASSLLSIPVLGVPGSPLGWRYQWARVALLHLRSRLTLYHSDLTLGKIGVWKSRDEISSEHLGRCLGCQNGSPSMRVAQGKGSGCQT